MNDGFYAGASRAALALFFSISSGSAHAQATEPSPPADQGPFLDREYFESWYLGLINANEAYRLGYSGKGVTIVLDTGLDTDHPDFKDRVSTISRSFVTPTLEKGSHGTHVTGIAAAAHDGNGTMGVAPDADILAAQIISEEGDEEEAVDPERREAGITVEELRKYMLNNSIVKATNYVAQHHAKVINASFGPSTYPTGDPGTNPYYRSMPQPVLGPEFATLYSSANLADDADIVLVAAAGNEYGEQPDQSAHPGGYGFLPLITPENHRAGVFTILDFFQPRYPGKPDTYRYIAPDDPRLKEIDLSDMSNLKGSLIAVVATDRNGKIASYSNRCGLA